MLLGGSDSMIPWGKSRCNFPICISSLLFLPCPPKLALSYKISCSVSTSALLFGKCIRKFYLVIGVIPKWKNSISRRPAFIPTPWLHLYNSIVALFSGCSHTQNAHTATDRTASKCFYGSRCMCGGQKQTNKQVGVILYSDDLLLFPNTVNLIPSYKYYLRRALAQGVGGPPAAETARSGSVLKLGWLLSCHFERVSAKLAHMGREHADFLRVCPPTHSILRVPEASEELLVQDQKSFLLSLSLNKPRKMSRGLRWTHLSIALRSFNSVEQKK